MKKLLLSAIVFTTLSVTAQNSKKKVTTNDYKPNAGTVTTEFGLTGGLLDTDLKLNNNSGLLRFRYFSSSDVAFRLGLNVSNQSTTNNYFGGTGNALSGNRTRKNNGITINLGIEKHLTGSNRLSTYVGADLTLGVNAATEKWENSNGSAFVQGLSRDIKGFNTVGGGTNAASTFGFRLLTGADYYFVKNLYIGGEIGFGLTSSKFKDITDKTTTITGTTVNVVSNDIKSPGKSTNFSPSVITGIRIGYQF